MEEDKTLIDDIINLRGAFNDWLLSQYTRDNIVSLLFIIYLLGTIWYIFDFSRQGYKDQDWKLSFVALANVFIFNLSLLLIIILGIFVFPQSPFTLFLKEFLKTHSFRAAAGLGILFAASVATAGIGVFCHWLKIKRC